MIGMDTNKLGNLDEGMRVIRVCWTGNFKDGRQGEKWDTGRVSILGVMPLVCWR